MELNGSTQMLRWLGRKSNGNRPEIVQISRRRGFGFWSGAGMVLDLGGTSFCRPRPVRYYGMNSDVVNLRSDFDAAIREAEERLQGIGR